MATPPCNADIVEREGMSFERFIALAMTEKASAIATEAYLEARAQPAMDKVADLDPPADRDKL